MFYSNMRIKRYHTIVCGVEIAKLVQIIRLLADCLCNQITEREIYFNHLNKRS